MGQQDVGYTGSKTLVWSGPLNSPSGQAPSYPSTATTVTFTEGVGTATAITLYDALSTTLTATEGTIAGHLGRVHGQGRRLDEARVHYLAEHPDGGK